MCEGCAALKEENEMLRTKLDKAHDDLLTAAEGQTATAKELRRVRRELADEQATGPTAAQVARALEFWAEGRPGRKPNVSLHGGRARLVRQAIQLGHTDPPLPCPVHDEQGKRRKEVPRDAECTVVDELIEAFEGLKLVPFVGPQGRCKEGVPGAKRFDDVTYALTVKSGQSRVVSEQAIETMRSYARRARLLPSERCWQAYEATQPVADFWFRLAMELHEQTNGNGRRVESFEDNDGRAA